MAHSIPYIYIYIYVCVYYIHTIYYRNTKQNYTTPGPTMSQGVFHGHLHSPHLLLGGHYRGGKNAQLMRSDQMVPGAIVLQGLRISTFGNPTAEVDHLPLHLVEDWVGSAEDEVRGGLRSDGPTVVSSGGGDPKRSSRSQGVCLVSWCDPCLGGSVSPFGSASDRDDVRASAEASCYE